MFFVLVVSLATSQCYFDLYKLSLLQNLKMSTFCKSHQLRNLKNDSIFKIKRTVGEKKSLPNIIVEPVEMYAIDKG